jgi:hypothetical protein
MYHHSGLERQRKSLFKFSIRDGVGDGIIIINRGETAWFGRGDIINNIRCIRAA